MKIEFGGGEKPRRPEFKQCDIRQLPNIDYVCAAWDIDKHIEENTVDEIFSRHFFEHLTFLQGEKVLESWYKILKVNGKCEIILPNMSFHINQWISRNSDEEFDHAKAGFWGWQRGKFLDSWDIHKSGYDFNSLSTLLKNKNFKNIVSLKNIESPHLHVICQK